MPLSTDLISQFVKITKDNDEVKKETTVYGTAVDATHVKLDGYGSADSTPVETTVVFKQGDRVKVLIKNHTATVTGNITDPSANYERVDGLNKEVTEIKNVVAGYVSAEQLDAANARIDKLAAADVTIQGTLDAHNANFEKLFAEEGIIAKLQAEDVEINGTLEAHQAVIDDLDAKVGSFGYIKADNADITQLKADVADINTLMFKNAAGATIHTSFSNAVIAQVGNAQIKSAMIESIDTSKVTIASGDDTLRISGNLIQFKDGDNVKMQLGKDAQGKYSVVLCDENGATLLDKDGIKANAVPNQLIVNDMVSDDAAINGKKLDIDSVISEINNDGSKTISATKISVDAVGNTLDVSLQKLTTLEGTVKSQGTQISANTEAISTKVTQQEIDAAISDVNSEITSLSTQYSTLDQTVNGISTTVANHTTEITRLGNIEIGGRNLLFDSENGYAFTGKSYSNSTHADTKVTCTVDGGKADHYSIINANQFSVPLNELTKEIGTELTFSAEVKITGTIVNPCVTFDLRSSDNTTKISVIRAYADSSITDRWQRISGTAVISETDVDIVKGLIALLYDSATLDSSIEYRKVKLERGNKATDWTSAPEDIDSDINDLNSRISNSETVIRQNSDAILACATKTEVSTAKNEAISVASADAKTKADNALASANANTNNVLKNYSTTSEMNAAIQLKAEGITSSVSSTYATISSLNITNTNVTAAQQAANDAQSDIDNLTIGGRNHVSFANLQRYSGGNLLEPLTCWTVDGTKITATSQPLSNPLPGFKIKVNDGYTYIISGHTDLATFKTYHKCFDVDGNQVRAQASVSARPVNGYFEIRIDVPDTTAYFNIGVGSDTESNYYIDRLKIERGTRATDWTPAPEDMATAEEVESIDARVTSAESSITQLSNKITANVTETTNLGTRMTTVEQTATGLTARVTTAETDIITATDLANNAAKTATNYLNFSDSGLIVGDMTTDTLGKNVRVASSGVEIRDGETVAASFEANKVTLGRNAEESVIDLCGGAGRISANTASASTSYPYRNAILIESKEIETEGVYFTATATNECESDTEPDITRMAQLYLIRSPSDSSVSNARIEAEHLNNSTNTYVNTGFSAMTYDNSSNTRALMYAYDSGNKVYNKLNVYTSKATLDKPLYIDGIEFSGNNKVLWSGGSYMSAAQTATLSEAISKQANGIVLVFSRYSSSTAQNYHFNMHYVPKAQISNHGGCGHTFLLSNDGTFGLFATKYLYIHDTKIVGNDINTESGTGACGITYSNGGFVLRYVIGV